MTLHSYSCYNHSLFDSTDGCTCHREIEAGMTVRYYPNLLDETKFTDTFVTEVFVVNGIKLVKLKDIDAPINAIHCVITYWNHAA